LNAGSGLTDTPAIDFPDWRLHLFALPLSCSILKEQDDRDVLER